MNTAWDIMHSVGRQISTPTTNFYAMYVFPSPIVISLQRVAAKKASNVQPVDLSQSDSIIPEDVAVHTENTHHPFPESSMSLD